MNLTCKYGPDVLVLTRKMIKEGAFDKEIVAAINSQLGHNISVVAFRQYRYRHGIGRIQDGGTPKRPADALRASGDAIFDRDARRRHAEAVKAEKAFRKAIHRGNNQHHRNIFNDDQTVPDEPVVRMDHPATHVETQSSAANAPI